MTQHLTTNKVQHAPQRHKEEILISYNKAQDHRQDLRNQYKSEVPFCGFNDGLITY